MAVRDNNLAISQPAYVGENGPVQLISEKEKKKQQEELLKLAAALQAVEADLAKSKTEAKGGKIVPLQPAKGAKEDSSGPSSSAVAAAMAEMVLLLQTLQVEIAKFSNEKANYDAQISQDQVYMSQQNLQKAIEEQQKIQTEGFWAKIGEAIVAAISAIAAIVTCNPELLVITALSVLAMTGVMSDVSQGISSVLQDMGASKQVADAVASAIVVVVILVCTWGMGGAAAAETAGEEAGAEAAQAASQGASQAAGGAGNAAADSTSLIQKAKDLLSRANIFAKLSPRTNMMIAAGLQSASSTGLITNIAEAIMTGENISQKDRQHIESIISDIVAAVAIIASIGASSGMAAKSVGTTVEKMGQDFVKFSRALFRVAGFGQAIGMAAEGGMNVMRGLFEKELAVMNANLGLLRTSMDMNNTQMGEDQKHTADVLKQQSVGNKSVTELAKGEAGFANLFTQHSPV